MSAEAVGPRLAKAVRLLAEGRVVPGVASVQEFVVDGDNDRYSCFVGAHTQVCTCPSRGRCSHLEAVGAWVTASDDERALMRKALDERKARDAALAEEAFARLTGQRP